MSLSRKIFSRWMLLSMSVMGFGFLSHLSGCGDGAVSDLLGTDEGKKEDFSAVDDGVKSKFTKLEMIKADQLLTLKVELFSFSSSDDLLLTNLSPMSFVPSRFGAEKLPEGLKFKNGFISEVQLIDPLSCGRLLLSDLKIILCPGSINVAYATKQNPNVSLGADLANMVEISKLAKKTSVEFSALESEVSVALSEKLEKTEQTTKEAAGEDVIVQIETQPSPTPAPTLEVEQVGIKPKSHVLKEKSILGLSGSVTVRVMFAKDYIVLVYKTWDELPATIQIYDKDFSNGFTLLNEANSSTTFKHLDVINVSSDGKKIYISGRKPVDINENSYALSFMAKEYDVTTNTFRRDGGETITQISPTQFLTWNRTHVTKILHADETAGSSRVRAIASAQTEDLSEEKLFIVEGEIGKTGVESWMVTPMAVISGLRAFVRPIKMLLENGLPLYFVTHDNNEPTMEDDHTALLKYEQSTLMLDTNYGKNVLVETMGLIPSATGLAPWEAKSVNGTDIYVGFSAHKSNSKGSIGVARIDSSGRTVWTYDVDVWGDSSFIVQDMDYDANKSGHLVGVLYKSAGPSELKLVGLKFQY